jgi:hypothetical protein
MEKPRYLQILEEVQEHRDALPTFETDEDELYDAMDECFLTLNMSREEKRQYYLRMYPD